MPTNKNQHLCLPVPACIRKHLVLFLFVCLLHTSAWCFTFETNQWYDFSGKLKGKLVYITLFQNDEGLVQGSYRNCDGTNKVLLSGLVNSKGMSLSGSVKGKVCELFELQNVSDSTDRLQGTFSVKGSKARSNVSFRLESICGGNLEHRYSDFFGVDEDVEQFMLEIQQAVKNSDKLWLATHVQYPIEVKMGGNKKQTLKNQNQLIQQYEKIFTPAYKKKLLASCTCNLFVNNNGIMLGSGEIWINQKENSTEELYDFVITTLNN